MDDVEFRIQLRVEDVVLMFSVARNEGITVHELILRAIRQYLSNKMTLQAQGEVK